jgi:hypothetical protein
MSPAWKTYLLNDLLPFSNAPICFADGCAVVPVRPGAIGAPEQPADLIGNARADAVEHVPTPTAMAISALDPKMAMAVGVGTELVGSGLPTLPNESA